MPPRCVTGFGVAVMQPAMPPLVRAWLPDRIGFGTAVYTNGLLIGEIIPVALTLPMVLPLVGGSWRLAFVAWAIPCVALAVVMLVLAPRQSPAPRQTAVAGIAGGAGPAPPRRWWPDWHSGTMWRLGLMLGGVNATYFSTNAFLPEFLTQTGRGDLVGPALVALNTGQLPASFLLLAFAGQFERNFRSYIVCGLLCFAGVLTVVLGQRELGRRRRRAGRLRGGGRADPDPRTAGAAQCAARTCRAWPPESSPSAIPAP